MIEIKEKELYTVREAAIFFKCSKKTIYKKLNDKTLSGLKGFGEIKITGKSILSILNSV